MEQTPHFHWDVLLSSIEEGRVIPVIGPELLIVQRDGRPVNLYQELAERLARSLDITTDHLPTAFGLNEVACCFLGERGQRSVLYSTLHRLLKESPPDLPEPLLRLAEVAGLRLFVSTTFDDMMVRAVNQVRFAGAAGTQARVFSLRQKIEDLPTDAVSLTQPLVFRIFGASSTAADFVVTDEDLLEFIFALRNPDRRPALLFDAFRDWNLLVLGCSFPNWLSRFFVRVIADMRLLDRRDTLETVADDHSAEDPNLVLFLQHCNISVFESGGTLGFVDELNRRWKERHPEGAGGQPDPTPEGAAEPDVDPMPGGAIFLSYASEDRPRVLVLKQALEEAGFEVWFDQRRLEAGDDYELKIRRNIETCSYFFPLISRASAGRVEGYYRKEWYWALERSRRFEKSFPFIQPIVLDDTPYDIKGIPEEFSNRHWQVFPGGVPTREFIDLTRTRIRELRKRLAGR